MSAKSELMGVYNSWREWTEIEREAILASDWGMLEGCHQAKLKLQKIIVQLTEATQKEGNPGGPGRPDIDRDLRMVVAELIVLEARNTKILDTKRQAARDENAELNQTRFRLRNVQRSYAVQPASTTRNGYS